MELYSILYHTVKSPWLASDMKSGSLPVLATPAMIAWMEETACKALDLDEGKTSVGIEISTSHVAASLEGTRVCTVAKLLGFNGKIAKFEVAAYAKGTLLGKGVHTRAVVDADRFMQKLQKQQ